MRRGERWAVMGSEAVNEPLLFGKHRLLPRERGLLVFLPNRPFSLVEIVVAGIAVEFTTIRKSKDAAPIWIIGLTAVGTSA